MKNQSEQIDLDVNNVKKIPLDEGDEDVCKEIEYAIRESRISNCGEDILWYCLYDILKNLNISERTIRLYIKESKISGENLKKEYSALLASNLGTIARRNFTFVNFKGICEILKASSKQKTDKRYIFAETVLNNVDKYFKNDNLIVGPPIRGNTKNKIGDIQSFFLNNEPVINTYDLIRNWLHNNSYCDAEEITEEIKAASIEGIIDGIKIQVLTDNAIKQLMLDNMDNERLNQIIDVINQSMSSLEICSNSQRNSLIIENKELQERFTEYDIRIDKIEKTLESLGKTTLKNDSSNTQTKDKTFIEFSRSLVSQGITAEDGSPANSVIKAVARYLNMNIETTSYHEDEYTYTKLVSDGPPKAYVLYLKQKGEQCLKDFWSKTKPENFEKVSIDNDRKGGIFELNVDGINIGKVHMRAA